MKTTYRFIIAALAAAVALSSCTKDIAADREDVNPQDGLRTIAVSFAAPTKSSWTPVENGIQPEFDKGDVIKVSNGSACKEETIDLDPQGNPYFTTSLTGALTAVYPATAAALEGNNITGVKVPAIQTGRFADANICMANIDANATSATFHNKTAILRFYVDQSIDVRALVLRSNNYPISTESIMTKESAVNMEKKLIYVLSEGQGDIMEAKSKGIENLIPLWQGTDDPDKRISYVAVLPISGDDIRFMSMSLTQENNESGKIYSNVTLKEGDIANAFIPYYVNVVVGGTIQNPEIQKWSYCNIGAFLPEESGYYYSWGNVEGHWKNGISDEYPFDYERYKESQGIYLTSDIQPTSPNDAAFNAWVKSQGGSGKWRMPTKAEFETLYNNTELSGDSENNLLIINNTLKFPLSGIVNNGKHSALIEGVIAGAYWTATIDEYDDEATAVVCAANPEAIMLSVPGKRFNGFPIRPIYGEPAVEPTNVEIQPFEEKGNI